MTYQPKRALPPELLAHCRELRRRYTLAEQLLWALLRNRQLNGFKFRRQHPLNGFILDFYCHEARLAVEVDGGGHGLGRQAHYDQHRTQVIEAEGIRVMRFWNYQVMDSLEDVLRIILEALEERTHTPSP